MNTATVIWLGIMAVIGVVMLGKTLCKAETTRKRSHSSTLLDFFHIVFSAA